MGLSSMLLRVLAGFEEMGNCNDGTWGPTPHMMAVVL